MIERSDLQTWSKSVDKQLSGLSASVQHIQLSQNQLRDQQAKDTLIEINTKTFDKAQTYTSVIIGGAYLGLFTLLSSSKDTIGHTANVWTALCLCFSLICFVTYEILGMGLRSYGLLNNRRMVVEAKDHASLEIALAKMRKTESSIAGKFLPWWIVSLFLTVFPAFFAAGLLMYGNLAFLAGWPLWPK